MPELAPRPKPPPRGALSALSHPAFRLYFVAQALSLVGGWMQAVAQGWVTVQVVGDAERAAATIAFVSVVSSIPMVALALVAGLAADRLDRRRLLIATQLALALCAFAYAALVASGHLRLVHVYAMAVVTGAAICFDLPAANALVAQLVPIEDLGSAIALNQSAFHSARLIGPTLAALAMGAMGAAAAFIANGLSFFFVIGCLMVIRTRPRPPRVRVEGGAGFLEGVRYILGNREIAAVIGYTALATSFVFPFIIIFMPLVVARVFGGGEGGLGTLMTSGGLGALVGAVSMLRIPAGWRRRAIVLGATASGLGLAGFAAAPSLPIATPLVAVVTFGISLSIGLGNTIVQTTVPDEVRGRVVSIHVLMWTGVMPIAGLGIGLIGDALGLRAALAGMAGAFLLTALPWLLWVGFWRKAV